MISGIIHMLRCGGRWQDCPPEYGPATTSKTAGIAGAGAGCGIGCSRRCQRKDNSTSWHARLNLCEGASLGAWWKRGAKAQAIGVSRGGQTTKIHAVCDLLGRPVALTLTPGNTSDIKAAELLKEHVTGFRRLVADRGYDANQYRGFLKQAGTIPSSLAAFTASGASAKTNNATRVAG
ncbi:Transposase DDE domain-containing protein [Bosea lupini]|uniref:Transposase DDE domain-containing protein n=1 Tax=Bosea lupini TaxID=1036779 RepID=A0A1H7YPY5_9HYPH|nr:Transposase DDE domain-containing protein [Bosea lupini]